MKTWWERGQDVAYWWLESREQFVDDVISEANEILQERERV